MILFFVILACSLLGAFLHLFLSPKKRTQRRVVELLLLYQLVFNVGLLGFLAFIGLTFMPKVVAAYNGWPTCPFQQEMGNVNLAFGILGIMSIWKRGLFWSATVIGASIWLFADGINHFVDRFVNHNYSEGNTGVLLYTDLLLPIFFLCLLYLYRRLK